MHNSKMQADQWAEPARPGWSLARNAARIQKRLPTRAPAARRRRDQTFLPPLPQRMPLKKFAGAVFEISCFLRTWQSWETQAGATAARPQQSETVRMTPANVLMKDGWPPSPRSIPREAFLTRKPRPLSDQPAFPSNRAAERRAPAEV